MTRAFKVTPKQVKRTNGAKNIKRFYRFDYQKA